MSTDVLLQTSISDYRRRQGKVRDIYDLGDTLLIVATDRISAFDVVMPNGIPHKGKVLTQISQFWFDWLGDRVRHHSLGVVRDEAPAGLDAALGQLAGRAMHCVKTEVVPIECVVRGYVTGSGWKDYLKTGAICGIKLPAGLKQCEQLPEPIFTPSTKAEVGHDENIDFERACEIAGRDAMTYIRDASVEVYKTAAQYARQHGIIIADTKFEWGMLDGEFILIDEVLTPDSSRFWPAEKYEPGHDQPSFDKQFVRNWLEELCTAGKWDKTPPGPELPADICEKTSALYINAYERLTGKTFKA